MTFKDGKKLIVTGLTISIAFTSSCKPIEELKSKISCDSSTSYETIATTTNDIDTQVPTETERITINSETETEETTKKPSSYEDIKESAIPTVFKFDQKNLSEDEFMKYYLEVLGKDGFILSYFGDLNPITRDNLRKVTGNPNINIDDCEFFQYSLNKYKFSEYDFSKKGFGIYNSEPSFPFLMSIVRYIMAENGLRFMEDELPFEYFEEKFPEYWKMVQDKTVNDMFNLPDRSAAVSCKSISDVENASKQYPSCNFQQSVAFWACYYYKYVYDGLRNSYKSDEIIEAKKYYNDKLRVEMTNLAYTKEQEKAVLEKLCEIPGYENFANKSIYDGETKDELAMMCNLDGYEEFFEYIDGAKMNCLKHSRTMTS